MQFSHALNPRRVSRSLATILVLTFIQTVAAPLVLPEIVAPKAEAVTDSYTPAQASSWTVPANVTSINVTLKGGSAGIGGIDCGADCTSEPGGPRGVVTYTFNVSPGDLIGIFPGNKGVNGTSTRLGGADTTLLGTFDGGNGGDKGDYGGSGGGGGGGAASVLTINGTIRAVAGGAGGGGGAANSANSATAGADYNASNVVTGSYTGGTGVKPIPATCNGTQTNSDGTQRDGGGGGGGGGGWFAGAGGGLYRVSGDLECAGYGGYRGGNYLKDNSNVETIGNAGSSETVADTNGSIDITYTIGGASGSCTPVSTTDVDIYRILKFTNTSTCTWTVPADVTTVDFFMVGAGGGGGAGAGSGGAGGGSISRSAYKVTAGGSLNLTVGIGGRGGIPSASKAGPGLSTVVVDGASTFTSYGGGAGAQGPDRLSYPVGGSTTNGSTAIGLQGGAGGLSSDVGGNPTPGQRGSTNYFYGIENQYAGGGSGGSYPGSGGSISAVASFYGGGSSGSAVSGVGTNGGDASANTGAGGGGGTSANSQTSGGRGANGVILIRYAINSADAFPASLSSALTYRFAAGDYQTQPYVGKTWINSAGTSAPVATANITGSPTIVAQDALDTGNSTGSNKTDLAVRVTTSQRINLLDLQTGYTLFHVARYVRGGTADRIISATGSNWLSGFDNSELVTYHGSYIGNGSGAKTYKWRLTTDQSKLYRSDGVDISNNDANIGSPVTSVTGFGINQTADRYSDAQVSDIIIFNRELNNGEIRAMENYLARIHGLSLNPLYYTSETDTALLTTSYDMFIQKDSRNNVNDTFTVEAWIKPDAACDNAGRYCTVIDTDLQIRLSLYEGKLSYMLRGDSSWEWIYSGVPVKSGEWHHIAYSKTLSGNRNDSLKIYLDGRHVYTKAGNPYKTATTQVASPSDSLTLAEASSNRNVGSNFDGGSRFAGYIDELKIWKTVRSETEIQADMHSNDGSNPLMQAYYDFNFISGDRVNSCRLPNLAYGGGPRSDLFAPSASTSYTFADVKESSPSTLYTTLTFPRSYITQYGGWKVPTNVSQVQTVVVGGGGGGGGGYEGGGGGAGGFIETVTTLNSGKAYPIVVGFGGRGTISGLRPTNGESSTAFGITSLGGGSGNFESYSDQAPAGSGGSGGGGSWGHTYAGGTGTSGQGNKGGNSSALNTSPCTTYVFVGGGGGGAGTEGQDASCAKGGNGGDGKFSVVMQSTLAAGGGGSVRVYATSGNLSSSYQGLGGSRVSGVSLGGDSAYYDNVAVDATGGAKNGKYATGSGGGAGYASNPTLSPYGTSGSGGSGVVAVRYLNATKPTYSKPTNAYLNAGMTETFTTNVAVDSATAGLTRTFKWESTTPTSGGVYTTLKVGTGAANAAYSWVPSDTSTTGSGYLYRLTVTDSDTAGLFITDSSTAYAVINPALNVSGTSAIVKKINIARNETFTITLGTPTYRASLSPVIPGITLDTSTAGSPVLKIAETATVGTWLETITVIDSVTGRFDFPLSITIAAPPTLLNTGEIATTGLKLHLDSGNSESFLGTESATASTTKKWKDISGNSKDASTGGTYDGSISCSSPIYSAENMGSFSFTGTGKCFNAPYLGESFTTGFTVEAWFKSTNSTITSYGSLITQYQSGSNQVAYMLGPWSNNKITVSVNGSSWLNCEATSSVVQNRWTHALGTFDGSQLKIYIDGNLENTCNRGAITLNSPTTAGTWIGRRWDSGTFFTGNIATARIYNRALSAAEALQNFEATKSRFDVSNAKQSSPSKKYGTLVLESFTATSGYGARNFSLVAFSPAGIEWDVSVTDRLNVSVQESLTVGTYYDTLTVTDALGQSSYLPITFTVTKADTLTVTMGSPLTVVYNGLVPSAAPKASISGLVGVDTATVLTRYDTATIGSTCATGGVCKIGDTGPGGGKVFYISDTTINAATGISEGGVYLEVAPLGWHTTQGQEEALAWSSVSTSVPGTLSDIGAGAENSRLVYSQLGASSAGFNVIVNKTIGGKSDWFVPSLGELEKVYENLWATGLDAFTGSRNMLSSTEDPSNTSQAMQVWNVGGIVAGVSKTTGFYMRPIRAFGGTTTPTESDSYTAQGHNLTFGVGAASNYVNVVYETSTLKITQANQEKLMINLYGAVAGTPFTLQISGGSGTGVITETVTAGSTALNCRISNRVLANDTPATEQKTCNIAITKAASRNYKSETLNATVYFMMFDNNQPTGQVGSGSTIALNGVTSFETSTTEPPTISRLDSRQVIFTVCPGGIGICTLSDVYVIRGTGFGDLFSTPVKVKFSRNKIVELGTTYQSGAWVDNDTTIVLTSLPAGISPGRIVIITPNGEGVSDFTFTP